MSTPFLIIDGYNLLHAAGLARMQYGPGDLERSRHRMLALLSEKLRADERCRCTVVFDARQAPCDLPRQSNHQGITILFAPPGQDADTEIERLIVRHPASRRLLVVSSDHRLHQAAKRRQAKPIDSESFVSELNRRESISPHLSEPASPPQQMPSKSTLHGSTEEWQAVFGEIDVQMIVEEVSREPLAGQSGGDPDQSRLDELQRRLDDPDALEQWLKGSNSV